MKYYIFFLLTLFVFAAQSQVKINVSERDGWDNVIELQNGVAKVLIVADIGRVLHYGFVDSNNVFLRNDDFVGVTLPQEDILTDESGDSVWATFGGDRVWPTPEDLFESLNGHFRPPDHWIDGGRYKFELIHNGVRIVSAVSQYCGARLIRDFVMDTVSAKVFISQRLEKVQLAQNKTLEPVPLTIWNMSRLPNPKETILQMNKESRFENSYKPFIWDGVDNDPVGHLIHKGEYGVFVPDTMCQKVGADSHNWVAGVVGNTVIGEFFDYSDEAEYPDGGTSATICYCPGFVEIECLSPIERLLPGQTMEFNIIWDLFSLPKGSIDEQREAAVRWLQEER